MASFCSLWWAPEDSARLASTVRPLLRGVPLLPSLPYRLDVAVAVRREHDAQGDRRSWCRRRAWSRGLVALKKTFFVCVGDLHGARLLEEQGEARHRSSRMAGMLPRRPAGASGRRARGGPRVGPAAGRAQRSPSSAASGSTTTHAGRRRARRGRASRRRRRTRGSGRRWGPPPLNARRQRAGWRRARPPRRRRRALDGEGHRMGGDGRGGTTASWPTRASARPSRAPHAPVGPRARRGRRRPQRRTRRHPRRGRRGRAAHALHDHAREQVVGVAGRLARLGALGHGEAQPARVGGALDVLQHHIAPVDADGQAEADAHDGAGRRAPDRPRLAPTSVDQRRHDGEREEAGARRISVRPRRALNEASGKMLASAQRVLECLPDGVARVGHRAVQRRRPPLDHRARRRRAQLPLRIPGAPSGAPQPATRGAPSARRRPRPPTCAPTSSRPLSTGAATATATALRSGAVGDRGMGCGLGKTFVGGEVCAGPRAGGRRDAQLRRRRAVDSTPASGWASRTSTRRATRGAAPTGCRTPSSPTTCSPASPSVLQHATRWRARPPPWHPGRGQRDRPALDAPRRAGRRAAARRGPGRRRALPDRVCAAGELRGGAERLARATRTTGCSGWTTTWGRGSTATWRRAPTSTRWCNVALGLGPKAAMTSAGHRSALGQAIEACHPVKVQALRRILARGPTGAASSSATASWGAARCTRRSPARSSSSAPPRSRSGAGCSAGWAPRHRPGHPRHRRLHRLPAGHGGGVCALVSGSRQRVQRCGRGSRGATTGARRPRGEPRHARGGSSSGRCARRVRRWRRR